LTGERAGRVWSREDPRVKGADAIYIYWWWGAADRVYFMDQGRVMWEGSIQDVLKNDQDVAKKFLTVG